jgi:hypothetical protein
VFGTHCHQSDLDIGFGRIVPHGLAHGCLCLGLLQNKPATKAGTTRSHREEGHRDHENRGQRPGRQNHPEDHHHERGGRQPSQPAEQTTWRCSFPRWQPTRHYSSPRAAHGTCPIIACGSEFPLPPPAGPPGPDPPPASASRLAHPSARSLPRSICWPERTLKPWFAFASRSGHPCPPDEPRVERPRSLGVQRERQGAPIVRSHCSRTEERTALYCDEPKSAEHVRVE